MKKILTLLVACLLVLSCALPVCAADGKVTYAGKAEQFIFEPGSEYSPTDLFPNFKGVMPGDTLTQQITVKNDASRKVKVRVYIRSLGAHEDSVEFLSQLGLKVKKSDNNTMAYMFDAAADQTAQLTDWVYLGTLYSGGKVNLDVELHVPVELDNEFQNSIGYLDWEFMIEEFPIDPDDPTPPPVDPDDSDSPQTGDDTAIILYAAIMCCSLLTIIVLLIWRKKNKENEKNTTQF